MPLFLFLTITTISIFFNLSNDKYQENYLNLGLILAIYNVIIILVALIALFDAPLALETQYQTLKHPVKITNNQDLLRWGTLQKLSEKEAQILLDQPLDSEKIIVAIGEVNLRLSADLVAQEKCGQGWRITVKLSPMDLSEQRKLITFLFCRPHRWSCQNTPGEIQSLWLLLKSFGRGIELIGKSFPFLKSIFVKKTL
jgi:cellulose synthase (UDP-forming)